MSLYRVYLSTGEILEQDAPSSGYLYKCVRYRMRIEPTEFQAAICLRVDEYGLEHRIWVMTSDPFDGLRITKWGQDKAHRMLARQTFLFNSGDRFWSKSFLDDLFCSDGAEHKLFTLED